ncbi:hypothetical protein BHE74_00011659 [Ensete ventricosum]|nr:hypothetical protein BHE74_00011659 [Ensete ventricosum]RZR85151.1 hypothetical protein BHM03_00012101 [Ensete ventricosum]
MAVLDLSEAMGKTDERRSMGILQNSTKEVELELQKRPLAEGKGTEGMDQEFIKKAEKNPLTDVVEQYLLFYVKLQLISETAAFPQTTEQERRLDSARCIAKANGEGLRVKVAEMPGFGMTAAEARGRNSNHRKLVAVTKEGR